MASTTAAPIVFGAAPEQDGAPTSSRFGVRGKVLGIALAGIAATLVVTLIAFVSIARL